MTDTALIVMVSKHGARTRHRALWRVRVRDAQRICSDPRTASRNSMLVWFGENNLPTSARGDAWEFTADDGRWDGLLSELGVTVLESKIKPWVGVS
jgi:hypothetical protein